MAIVKYRYQQVGGVNVEQLRKEVDASLTLDESHGGAIENVSVESAFVADLDEAMLRRGFQRIGSAVSQYPAEDDDFGVWKEAVLHINQLLNGASGGILQAIMIDVAVNPADGDTFVISDGTAETYTFRTTPSLAFDVQIGGSASATEANLATTINTDSTKWSAVQTTDLDKYFSPSAADQLVIYRKTTSLANDRVYGTIAGGNAGIQVIDFGVMSVAGKNDSEYGSDDGTQDDLLGADGTAKMFGFGRARAYLRTAESHFTASGGLRPYTWDENAEVWMSVASSDGAAELKFGADSLTATTTTRYLYPGYSDGLAQTSPVQYRATRNGVIRYMRVRQNSGGGNGNNIVYTFRKNGVNQTLTVTLASTATDGSDLVNSFTVAAGDLIDVSVTKALSIAGSPNDIVVTAEFTV